MQRYIKVALVFLFTIICMPFVLIAAYDIFYFQNELDSTLKQIDLTGISEQAYSPSFIKLAEIYYGSYLPAITATTLENKPKRTRSVIKIVIKSELLKLHLTHSEQLKIVANKLYLGKNCYGFQAASTEFFNKPFHLLSALETAKLVALKSGPDFYLANPKRHLEVTFNLLASAKMQP